MRCRGSAHDRKSYHPYYFESASYLLVDDLRSLDCRAVRAYSPFVRGAEARKDAVSWCAMV